MDVVPAVSDTAAVSHFGVMEDDVSPAPPIGGGAFRHCQWQEPDENQPRTGRYMDRPCASMTGIQYNTSLVIAVRDDRSHPLR
jgi:hypothetical protein